MHRLDRIDLNNFLREQEKLKKQRAVQQQKTVIKSATMAESITVSHLSKLQRRILVRAQNGHSYGKTHIAEVLIEFYGFTYDSECSTQKFKPDAIGRARYNAASAAVSRAGRRLEERGLIERFGGGTMKLTAKGWGFVLKANPARDKKEDPPE